MSFLFLEDEKPDCKKCKIGGKYQFLQSFKDIEKKSKDNLDLVIAIFTCSKCYEDHSIETLKNNIGYIDDGIM